MLGNAGCIGMSLKPASFQGCRTNANETSKRIRVVAFHFILMLTSCDALPLASIVADTY